MSYFSKGILLLVIGLSFSFLSNAQLNDFLFRHFKERKSVTYGLNNRRTSILNENSTIYGGYIGIKFGNRLKHVITLNSTVMWVGEPNADIGLEPVEVQLNFAGFSEEYVFWKHNQWAFSSYLHFGIGKGRFRSIPEGLNPSFSQWVFPAEFGIHSAYSPNKWLELRTGGGYRYVFNSADWPLHGFYYKVGAGLNIREFENWVHQVSDLFKRLKRSPKMDYPMLF